MLIGAAASTGRAETRGKERFYTPRPQQALHDIEATNGVPIRHRHRGTSKEHWTATRGQFTLVLFPLRRKAADKIRRSLGRP
jgi:hypothetical protein